MRKLVIVCDEKHKKYADYLHQLISLEDDTEESVVGVKDGSVQAVVWLEKDYIKSSKTFSSNQHIIFIGESKLIKEKSSYMKVIFSKFGISYGWLGRQAFLTVEKVVPFNKYEDFISFAQKYKEDIELLFTKKENTKKNTRKEAIAEKVEAGLVSNKLAIVMAVIAPAPLGSLLKVRVAIPYAKKLALKPKVKEQMYSFATMKFYLDDLNTFLGLD